MAASLGLALTLALTGCGETNPLNPNPQPTPTPAAARAVVTLSLDNARIDTGQVQGFGWALVATLRLAETAGLAATVDFVRLDLYRPDDSLLERTQLGGNQLPGGNTLAARGARDIALALGFNNDPLPGRYIIVSVFTTDARGNALVTSSGRLTFG
jgi:hypothetical protein